MTNQKYTYKECYSILNSRPDCDWKELRKQYKSLIQKWHPDRVSKAAIDAEQATSKITKINVAFHQLEQYYKKQGSLPDARHSSDRTQLHSSTYKSSARSKTTAENRDTVDTEASSFYAPPVATGTGNLKNLGKFLFLITGTAYIGFILLFSPGNHQASTEEDNFTRPLPPQTASSLAENKPENRFSLAHRPANDKTLKNNDQNKKVQYFTYGSTRGEVINAQGAPDDIKNNIWYYGASKIHFQDGIVVSWERGLDSPLHVRITPEDKVAKKKDK